MADAPSTATLAQHIGARTLQDYALRDAQALRGVVEEVWRAGTRSHTEVAAILNSRSVPSRSGAPWSAGSVATLIRRLRMNRETWAHRDAEALRDLIERLWDTGIRSQRELALTLNTRGVPRTGGRAWNTSAIADLLRRLDLHRADSWVTARRGESPTAIELPPEVPEVPEQIEPEEPQEAKPRRRAIRS